MKQLCCAFIGHSPMRFRFGWDEEDDNCIKLKNILLKQIGLLYERNVTHFMTACDPGIGLWCGELVNILRREKTDLQLYCIIPYEEQAKKWPPYLRERYYELLEKSTYNTAISLHKETASQRNAYKYMIEHADIILAVYDPKSARGDDVDWAMEYAMVKKRNTICIHPDTFVLSVANSTILPFSI